LHLSKRKRFPLQHLQQIQQFPTEERWGGRRYRGWGEPPGWVAASGERAASEADSRNRLARLMLETQWRRWGEDDTIQA
jgi:hypothetical protein